MNPNGYLVFFLIKNIKKKKKISLNIYKKNNDNLSVKSKKSKNSEFSLNFSSSKKRKVVFIKGKGLCLK